MDKKLAEVLAEVFGMRSADIHPELTKADVGTWDSLKQMDLVVSLERDYDISLDIMEIVAMTSVKSIMEVLSAKGISFEN